MYKQEFETAKMLAKEVGTFLKENKTKNIIEENGKDIKLELDKKAEELILKKLLLSFEHSILSEESGLNKEIEKNKAYWIIDPIDGSMNFSRENPSSCISIALWINNQAIFGVIYDFNRDELFSGYVGEGSYLNEKIIKKQKNISISNAILATGFPVYMDYDSSTIKNLIINVQNYKKIRMIGSAALSLAYVASNRFDTYMEDNIKLWDIAAGVAICKAMGIRTKVEILDNYLTNTKVGIFK